MHEQKKFHMRSNFFVHVTWHSVRANHEPTADGGAAVLRLPQLRDHRAQNAATRARERAVPSSEHDGGAQHRPGARPARANGLRARAPGDEGGAAHPAAQR